MVQCSVLPLKFHFCAQCSIDISLPCDESGISLFITLRVSLYVYVFFWLWFVSIYIYISKKKF